MSNSIEGAVSLTLAMQQHNITQQKNALLLRDTLDNQANTIARLVNSLPSIPQLATSGTVGTQVHTTA